MIKNYILAFALLITTALKAQYTLTAANNPTVGDLKQAYLLNDPLFPIGTGGGSGLNQVWNYTGLDLTGAYSYSTTYTNVASTPMAATFTAANIAWFDSDSPNTINYDNNSLAKTETIGQQVDQTTFFVDANRYTFNYPFAYGGTQTDNYAYSYPGLTTSGTVTSTGDGLGILNLPNGKSFTNALKMKTVEYEITTDASGTATSTTTSYTWYNATTKFPLFFLAMEVFTDVNGTTTTSVIYMDKSAYSVGLKDYALNKVNYTMSPNPTTGILKIELGTRKVSTIMVTIVNTLGQVVFSERIADASSDQVTLNINNLNQGVYFVNIADSNGNNAAKKIIKN